MVLPLYQHRANVITTPPPPVNTLISKHDDSTTTVYENSGDTKYNNRHTIPRIHDKIQDSRNSAQQLSIQHGDRSITNVIQSTHHSTSTPKTYNADK